MILFTRAVARDFRAVFGRCVSGRPRGPAPPVVVCIHDGTRTLTSTTPGGVTLSHTSPAPAGGDELVVLPATVLAEVEGGTDEPVALDRPANLRGVVRWPAGGTPNAGRVELILPGRQHEPEPRPPVTPVPARLLTALHECARTAARESGRFALSRVQLQGARGRVVGTDGKVAVLWPGWTFPFPDDALVPALPVFGSKPLLRVADVHLGRTATRLVVWAGPWAVWLPADTTGRYPDVAGLVPRHAPTTAAVDPRDAAELLRVLLTLPGTEDDLRPVTLDADRVLRVRGRGENGDRNEFTLVRSPTAGPAARAAVDRRVLARALAFGCHTLKLTPDKPVVFEGDGVTLVAAGLDPALVAAPLADPADEFNTPERSPLMKTPDTNGHPARDDPPDPLVAAEELRAVLAEATTKAARLVAALRAGRREKKVLAGLLAGLKQLNLDHPGTTP